MTKMKNTKKGMAKKALSISLIAAMLATSNVPVWAAFEAEDPADVAVEAQVFDAEAPAVDEVAPAELPVAEDPSFTDEASTYAAPIDEVNTGSYTEKDVKINVGEWDTEISVEGSIVGSSGEEIEDFEYLWMADGVQADGTDAKGNTHNYEYGGLSSISYTPTLGDYNKTLTLKVVHYNILGAVDYQHVFSVGKVEAKTLTLGSLSTIVNQKFNGKVQQVVPEFTGDVSTEGGLTENDITWQWAQKNNDFVNVTGENPITVVGVVNKNGYRGSSEELTYDIEPAEANDYSYEVSLNNTSFEYAGTAGVTLKKADVKIEAVIDETKVKVDITDALKGSIKIKGDDAGKIGTGYKAEFDPSDSFDVTEAAEKILANFEDPETKDSVESTNTYAVTARNLNNCTLQVTKDFEVTELKGLETDDLEDKICDAIKIVGSDGVVFDYVPEELNVTFSNAFINAVKNESTGTISNAITIAGTKEDENFTGSAKAALTLTNRSISSATVTITDGPLVDSKDADGIVELPFINKAYDLKKDYELTVEVNGQKLKSNEYTVEYDDNVNAGTVKVTIKGTAGTSYAGSSKVVYFKIKKVDLDASKPTITKKETVNVDPANNTDASKYAQAVGMSIKAELENNTTAVLKEGTDYTVKYFYGADDSSTTEDGDNIVGNYVVAKISFVKDGNYKGDDIYSYTEIVDRSFENVTVKLAQDSYTYTGEAIVPELTVTDGKTVLEKDVDYSLQITSAKNVGTATVKVVPIQGYDKNTSVTVTFKITAANAEDVVVTFKDKFLYNGGRQVKVTKDDIASIKLNGIDVMDDFDVAHLELGDNNTAGENAGSVTISPKTTNFTGTKTQKFDIVTSVLEGTLKVYNKNNELISADGNVMLNTFERYNGNAHEFQTVFEPVDKKAAEGIDYEIKYVNNVDAGYGYVLVTAKGNYAGEYDDSDYSDYLPGLVADLDNGTFRYLDLSTGKFNVIKNVVAMKAFQIQGSQLYKEDMTVENGVFAGGLGVMPKVTVKSSGKTLTQGEDYDIIVANIDLLNIIGGSGSLDWNNLDLQNILSIGTDATTGKPYTVLIYGKGAYETVNMDDMDRNGLPVFKWGIDKFDLKDAVITTENGVPTVKNGEITVGEGNYDVKDNGDGTITVTAKENNRNYTGFQTIPAETNAVPEITAVSDPIADRNVINVNVSKGVEGAAGYDYVLCENAEDLAALNFYKYNMSVDGNASQFQFVRAGSYKVYARAIIRDADGKKAYSDWSEAADVTISTDTPNATTINSVTVNGNKVTVTFTPGARTEGVDVMLGQTLRSSNGEPQRPVTSNFTKYLQKNLNATAGRRQTVTFNNVAKGTHYIGVHPYINSSDQYKYFGRWSKQTGATKVVIK